MKKYVHVFIGDIASWNLQKCLKEERFYEHQIICFKDDLSIGPVYKLRENLRDRIQWFKNSYDLEEEFCENEFYKTYDEGLNIDTESKIVIWYGNNVIEQTALRYLVNRFKDNKLYEVNVSTYIEKIYSYGKYKVKSVNECDYKELALAFKILHLIGNEKKEKLILDWENISNSHSTLRIYENAQVVNVEENYYDDEILKYVTKEFTPFLKVIGRVMGTCNQVVGDAFLIYRSKELMKQGILEFRGDLKDLKDLEVRLK